MEIVLEETAVEMEAVVVSAAEKGETANEMAMISGFTDDVPVLELSIASAIVVAAFSLVAVLFLPPTLIASIYGMNFARMPELGWWLGYPLALGLMVLSAALSYWYFKRRGWL